MKKQGFTLIELIMVIAILAIISTLAVTKYSSMHDKSAKQVSLANQIRLTQSLETFLVSNDGGLDKLDALIDYSTADGTAGQFAGEFGAALNETNSVGGIYRGPKGATATADTLKNNAGIHEDLAKLLCVYYPTAADVKALEEIGITRVMRSWTDAAAAPLRHGVTGEDGSAVLIESGIDPEISAAILATNAAGRALAAVNIAAGDSYAAVTKQSDYKKGARVYQECGADIVVKTDTANYDDPSDAASIGTLLAFGLGNSCTMIGNANGGLASAPQSEAIDNRYYRNYIVLIRLKPAPSGYGAATAEFAGILDPAGNTIEFAKLNMN